MQGDTHLDGRDLSRLQSSFSTLDSTSVRLLTRPLSSLSLPSATMSTPTPAAASSSSSSSTPPAAASSPSLLSRLDGSSALEARSAAVAAERRNLQSQACRQTAAAKRAWNEQIAKPTNEAARRQTTHTLTTTRRDATHDLRKRSRHATGRHERRQHEIDSPAQTAVQLSSRLTQPTRSSHRFAHRIASPFPSFTCAGRIGRFGSLCSAAVCSCSVCSLVLASQRRVLSGALPARSILRRSLGA